MNKSHSRTILIIKINFIFGKQHSLFRYIILEHRSNFRRDSLLYALFEIIFFLNGWWLITRLLSLRPLTVGILLSVQLLILLLPLMLLLLLLLFLLLLLLLFLLIIAKFLKTTPATYFIILWYLNFLNSKRI